MIALLKEIRHNPLLWLLSFVPVVFVAGKAWPEAHTLLFLLSVLAMGRLIMMPEPLRWVWKHEPRNTSQ